MIADIRRMLLTSRASARGMRVLAALKGSIAELRAIGINLNQMTRAVHQGEETAPGRQELQAMLKVAEGLRDHFRALRIANEKTGAGTCRKTSLKRQGGRFLTLPATRATDPAGAIT